MMNILDAWFPKAKGLPPPFSITEVLGAFLVFFLFYSLLLVYVQKLSPFPREITALLVFSFLLLAYALLLRKKLRLYFASPGVLAGLKAWVIAFPLVILWSSLVETGVEWATGEPRQEQIAVLALKDAPKGTLSFWILILYVILIVPMMEELLFRGFLQNWLRSKLSPAFSIGLTSFIFAFFHYAPGQGISNITIVSSLFLLSLVLGWLMFRTGSLKAPMALHSIFNTVSVCLIFIRGEG